MKAGTRSSPSKASVSPKKRQRKSPSPRLADGEFSEGKDDLLRPSFINQRMEELQTKLRGAKSQEERLDVQRSICSIKNERNKHASISKVGDEVLLKIFEHALQPPQPDGDSNRYAELEWDGYSTALTREEGMCMANNTWSDVIQIAHVSRHWRQVLFKHPILWSRPIFSNKSVLQQMISRSMPSPARGLSIRIPKPYPWLQDLTPSLSSKLLKMEHIRELHVNLAEEHLKTVLSAISGHSAHQLSSLLIRNSQRDDGGPRYEWPKRVVFQSDQESALHLPPTLFPMPMPQLLHLTLIDCHVDWESMASSISSELLTLKLCHVSRTSMRQFYSLLSQLPNLQTLYLAAALPLPPSNIRSKAALRAPNLAKLTSCTITASAFSDCVAFLSHIRYPVTSTNLFLYLCSEGNTNLVVSLLEKCSLFLDAPKRSHSGLMVQTFLAGYSGSGTRITLWDEAYNPSPPVREQWSTAVANPSVVIDLTHVQFTDGGRAHLLELLSVDGLKIIATNDPMRYSKRSWFSFFGRHPDIKHIHSQSDQAPLPIFAALTNCSEPGVFEEERCYDEGSDEGERFYEEEVSDEEESEPESLVSGSSLGDEPCLPDLLTITLEGHSSLEDCFRKKHLREYQQILIFLARRREVGLPLKKINLLECYWICLNDWFLPELRKRGVDVYWDRIFMPNEEEGAYTYYTDGDPR